MARYFTRQRGPSIAVMVALAAAVSFFASTVFASSRCARDPHSFGVRWWVLLLVSLVVVGMLWRAIRGKRKVQRDKTRAATRSREKPASRVNEDVDVARRLFGAAVGGVLGYGLGRMMAEDTKAARPEPVPAAPPSEPTTSELEETNSTAEWGEVDTGAGNVAGFDGDTNW